MSITGTPDSGPMRVGIAISDTAAGMFLGQGILLALLHRERTGEGQWVHTSLLEAMLNKIDFQGARYTMLGDVPRQQGNNHPVATPMGTYACRDGLVNIAASSIRMWTISVAPSTPSTCCAARTTRRFRIAPATRPRSRGTSRPRSRI